MLSRITPRLTYANVVSSIALFAVLSGGVAWAHGKIGTQDLRKGAVTTPKLSGQSVGAGKLKTAAIRPVKIAEGAVRTSKIFDGAVTGAKISDNSVTNAKLAGDFLRGPVRRVEAISANTSAAGQFRSATAACPPGERAIAGGGMWTNLDGNPTGFNILQGTRPVPFEPGIEATTGWLATGITNNAAPRQLRAYALCVPL